MLSANVILGLPRGHGTAKCGYQSCNPVKDDMINVHLVPHTHDDVGWLKTVDQYYYGSHNDIQNAGVQYVLDSVIEELLKDPTKRFIYVEIAFFARWWREQHDSRRHVIKGLVNSGQLEFILGGWCMNDEASTHYNAIIDQHSLGFEFLRQNFGDCGRPRVAWQVDPFGHSREQASLFAQMGFDGLFFGRLDYQDKDQRLNTTTMEMVWHGSPNNLLGKADLFTGVLYNGYGPPGGFCWDQFCNDDPIMDDPRLHDMNVESKTKDFLKAVHDQASHYATNHIMMTMGSDFQYQNAAHWYKNMDKLIQYVNALQQTNNSKVNVLYSTPSCYVYQLNKAGKTWTTKDDDFFPYASRPSTFWTGYFTSRAALKGYVRRTNNFLQACKQLDALAKLEDTANSTYNIQVLKEALGVVQHHDGVSGTEKQAVAYDYAQRLALGVYECQKVVNDAYKVLMPKRTTPPPEQMFCNLLNISACQFTEVNKQFVMTLYNPLGHKVSHWMRLPVIGSAYKVTGPDGKPLAVQIIPVSPETKRIPERKGSLAINELLFQVMLPPLGFSSYFIQMSTNKFLKVKQNAKMGPAQGRRDFYISNQHLSMSYDGQTGQLKSIKNLASGTEMPVTMNMYYYHGHPGNCSDAKYQPSGAYVFRPNTSDIYSWPSSSTRTSEGPLVKEVYTDFSPWASQVVRLYKDADYVEVEYTVGPIPVDDKIGKEVIARFETNMTTNELFYTDANGREILQRQRDYRPTWKLNQTEPVAGNYYPVNSRIYIQDKTAGTQLTVMTDRSNGGGSVQDGNIEIMLHRRLLYDDCLGVGEPLNETGSDGQGLIVKVKLFLFFDTIAASPKKHRDFGLKQYMQPIPSFATSTYKLSEYQQYFHTNWSGLTVPLAPNVHMLTLEQWGGPTFEPAPTQPYLIRLEHIYEKGEDPEMSKPATVSLKNLFVPFTIDSIEELTLGANLQLSNLSRLKWNTRGDNDNADATMYYEKTPPDVTLNPMEIRTFQVILAKGKNYKKIDKFSVFS